LDTLCQLIFHPGQIPWADPDPLVLDLVFVNTVFSSVLGK